jgi:hypothetical protein
MVRYCRRFYQATDVLYKTGITVATCLPGRYSSLGSFQAVIDQCLIQCGRFPQNKYNMIDNDEKDSNCINIPSI